MTMFAFSVGGLFTLLLMLPADFSAEGPQTDRLSPMAFVGGYVLAAIGPYVIGALLDSEATNTSTFIGFAAVAFLLGGFSLYFSHTRSKIGTGE
jgi:cyanate permease